MGRGATENITQKYVKEKKNASTQTVEKGIPEGVDTSASMENASLETTVLTDMKKTKRTPQSKHYKWK